MGTWGQSFRQNQSLTPPSKRVILHIDFDSYFASCEQQFNPALRGKPIGVTATNGRTCIIAASREAKKFGVKTGSRSWEAEKLCPDLQLVPAQFTRYWEISKKFIEISKDYSPFVEVFSLDEVFMDVTSTAHLFGGVQNLLHALRGRLAQEVGEYITVSVGVSHNKLLAKLASGMNKPNGQMEITHDNVDTVYRTTPLTEICGIGERIKRRLHSIGVFTLLELRDMPLRYLIDEFGSVEGNFLKRVGLGVDESPVIPYYDPVTVKSVGRSYCMPRNISDQRVILQNVSELCEELGIKLRRLKKKARAVGIGLRGTDNFSARKTFTNYLSSGHDIYYAVLYLLNGSQIPAISYLNPGEYVRQINIWVSYLTDEASIPESIFEEQKRKDKLHYVIDSINARFGDHTIRSGFLLYADKLTTVPNGFMADKYERVKLSQEEFVY